MKLGSLNYQKIKKKYLKFLKSQEIMSEPFRDKLGQLKKFYLPISNMINEEYLRDKRVKIIQPSSELIDEFTMWLDMIYKAA